MLSLAPTGAAFGILIEHRGHIYQYYNSWPRQENHPHESLESMMSKLILVALGVLIA